MKLAQVTGTVVSTIKYEKYRGFKLLKVRYVDAFSAFRGWKLHAEWAQATQMMPFGRSMHGS